MMVMANPKEEDLQPLLSKHEAKLKYPPGCPVWHGVSKLSPEQLDATEGRVKSAYIHIETGSIAYKVEGVAGSEHMIWERHLTYAMDCPVRVRGLLENDPNAVLDGTIVCPKPKPAKACKTSLYSYSIRFALEGNGVRLRLGVESDNITFRPKSEALASSFRGEEPGKSKGIHADNDGNGHDTTMKPLNQEVASHDCAAPLSVNSDRSLPIAQTNIHFANPGLSIENLTRVSPSNEGKVFPATKRADRSLSAHPNEFLHTIPEKPKGENPYLLHPKAEANQPPSIQIPDDLSHSSDHPPPDGVVTPNAPPTHGLPSPTIGGVPSEKDAVSERKRKLPSHDAGGISSRLCSPLSAGRSKKLPKRKEEGGVCITPPAENDKGATCILTVPSWVMGHHTQDDLFDHILGKYKNGRRGHKVRYISSETQCSIHVDRYRPMNITIKPNNPHSNVREAKRLVIQSLVDFIGDKNSERRLLYELAIASDENNGLSPVSGVVRQECLVKNRMVWMKLLELPSARVDGKLTHHGLFLSNNSDQRFLKGRTSCSVEVYTHGYNVPELSGPYVLVSGETPDEVCEVADRAERKIKKHMDTSPHKCHFLRR